MTDQNMPGVCNGHQSVMMITKSYTMYKNIYTKQ